MGAPVQASCPASSPVPMVSSPLPGLSCLPTGMVISLGFRADTVKIKVDGLWQSLVRHYPDRNHRVRAVEGNYGRLNSQTLVSNRNMTSATDDTYLMKEMDTERHLRLQYFDHEVILSCPLTLPTPAPTVPSADPQEPLTFCPFPWWNYTSPPFLSGSPGWPGPCSIDCYPYACEYVPPETQVHDKSVALAELKFELYMQIRIT
ncbi:hypothetical protein E1301_Tti017765 [Triplophysa tibetana]|uniref:Uncharacterized protein n=1 Tax=Triplophysa tibetana TaxID=1572043 RepID=A0A5A9MXV7_9TELE|nr:hypothetical protein E1301_Tti017765 [Triplophysa tibetana]